MAGATRLPLALYLLGVASAVTAALPACADHERWVSPQSPGIISGWESEAPTGSPALAADLGTTDLSPVSLLNPSHLTSSPLPPEVTERIENLSTAAGASTVLRELRYMHLIPEVRAHKATGVKQIVYRLPPAAANSRHITLVLGQHLPTRFGERLPEGVVAVVSHFPKGTIGALGPFLWVSANSVSRLLYGQDVSIVYGSLGYPDRLLAEIYVQDPFKDRRLPFRPTDRIGEFVGDQLGAGAVHWGAVYLYVDRRGAWRLVEYPDLPDEGDAVHLMWNFNPRGPVSGRREFNVPLYLRQSQLIQQTKTIRNPTNPQDNVGTSIIFRTDKTRGQTDFIALAPYLYLDNPDLMEDLMYNAPLPDGSLPEPDHLLVAAGDLHYVSNGKIGPLLNSDEDGIEVGRGVESGMVDLRQVRNHTGFYLGITRPASPATSPGG